MVPGLRRVRTERERGPSCAWSRRKPRERRRARRSSRHRCWGHLTVAPSKEAWLDAERAAGRRLVAVELAEGATPLPRIAPAPVPTVLLGHERHGVPDDVLAGVDECVEILMAGGGASLDVAVVGSLVLYRPTGLA
jgi:tRNA G18 (ribose-2'-O)-methylase SpoU